MRFFASLTIAASLCANVLALPTQEAALITRAPPTLKPGINIFYDAAGKMRVFGALVAGKYTGFNNGARVNPVWQQVNAAVGGDPAADAQALVSSLYSHCKAVVGTMGEIGKDVADFADWAGVWDINDVNVLGLGKPITVGIGIDHSGQMTDSATKNAWLTQFPGLIVNYFKGLQGAAYDINTPVLVDNAWDLGHPIPEASLKRGEPLIEKRRTPFCIEPIDLRPYITGGTPNFPNFWAACARS